MCERDDRRHLAVGAGSPAGPDPCPREPTRAGDRPAGGGEERRGVDSESDGGEDGDRGAGGEGSAGDGNDGRGRDRAARATPPDRGDVVQAVTDFVADLVEGVEPTHADGRVGGDARGSGGPEPREPGEPDQAG